MNMQGAKEPEIEAALGASLGATGDEQEQALTDAEPRCSPSDGWFVPVYEDFTYAGYNADKVTEPSFAGANNYLVLSSVQPALTPVPTWTAGGPARGRRPAPGTPPLPTGEPPMLAFVARRLAFAVVTVLAAVLISFLLVHATDTTPGAVRLGTGRPPPESVAAENDALGWNARCGSSSSTTWVSWSAWTSAPR